MDENKAVNHEPVTLPKERKTRKWLGLSVVIVVLLLLAGYSAYLWSENSKLSSDLANQKNTNQPTTQANTESKSDIPVTVTEKLDNGSTIKYLLTSGNAQLVFLGSPSGEPGSFVAFTHKKVIHYVATISSEDRKNICNARTESFDQTSVAMGFLDPQKKAFAHNQYANCLQSMAAPNINKNPASQQAAKKILDEVDADIADFFKGVTIE